MNLTTADLSVLLFLFLGFSLTRCPGCRNGCMSLALLFSPVIRVYGLVHPFHFAGFPFLAFDCLITLFAANVECAIASGHTDHVQLLSMSDDLIPSAMVLFVRSAIPLCFDV